MSNINLLNALNNSTAAKSTKQNYSLDEILFIMQLMASQVSLDEISNITGRSKHTLRYKFLEGEVTLNGKTMIRSVKKYKSMDELFTDHGAVYGGDEDVKARIEAHQAKLVTTQKAV